MTTTPRTAISRLLVRHGSVVPPRRTRRPLPEPRLPPKPASRTAPSPSLPHQQPARPTLPAVEVASLSQQTVFSLILRYLGRGIAYGAAATPFIFFWDHCFQLIWIRGPSMAPYLNEDYGTMQTQRDCVLVNKWAPAMDLQRGMVVMFPSLRDPHVVSVKRIIGLPGDRITPRSTSPLSKSYIVPWNHLWVEGDTSNPKESLDSNTFGPIPMNLVTGRAVAILAPRPRRLRWSDWKDTEDGPAPGQRARVEVGAVQLDEPSLF